ncbi:MAG: hypothetical protein WCH46_00900 [bacterium]
MNKFFTSLLFLSLACLGTSIKAQDNPPLVNGVLVAEFPMHFTNGYMFVTVPVIDTDVYGKAITLHRSFVLDPAASNDGSYIPDDSLINISGPKRFYLPVSEQRTLSVDLVPTFSKGIYKRTDTSYYGVLGYAFTRKYITVIDFANRRVQFFSTDEGKVEWNSTLEKQAIHVPFLDDAILAHCNCQFPTMWCDVKSRHIKEGRVHLSLAERQSTIFKQALEPKTQLFFEKKWHKDSLDGKKREPDRIRVETFELGGKDIAENNPGRVIADLPPIFRNLSIFITGTLAMDVIRTFDALIIDPTRSVLIFAPPKGR